MTALDAQSIERLAQAHGIGSFFHDFRGKRREISTATKAALLAAMGVSKDEGLEAHADRLLDPVAIIHQGTPARVRLILGTASQGRLDWLLRLENGDERRGFIDLATLMGSPDALEAQLSLPDHLPSGYHQLRVHLEGRMHEARIIITPMRCHSPPELTHDRVWGIAVQLYTLRSPSNWGIGDFGDLLELIELAAPLGCAVIGVNPLHALMPANPAHISPYSPSSRQFLNVLYVSVAHVPEYNDSKAAQKRVGNAEFKRALDDVRGTDNVDYVAVAKLKLDVLRVLHEEFTRLPENSERRQRFAKYVASGAEPLLYHAAYDALDEHFRAQSSEYWGWPSWPAEYQSPTSKAVQAFIQKQRSAVDFHLYLQWLADEQLAAAQAHALNHGMSIGLYGDVAVGVNSAGSETWSNSTLYRRDASIGAPPDPLALKGQDWGIPPQDPVQLREQTYEPFALMLRSNLRHVGALRLDHVMSLFRLWWVPRGFASTDGAYVHYPLEELMSVLALESERNECVIIGEDLGTVPDEMRHAMQRHEVYHYRVLLFEKEKDGRFKSPFVYTPASLATVTTHDLPTLRGWWDSNDIQLREQLNVYPDNSVRQEEIRSREQDRVALMRALVEQNLWRWDEDEALPAYSPALSRAIHAYLGLSRANIALVQLEDLIGMQEAVNVPGTSTEHPNWQRKMTVPTREIFARDDVRDILDGMRIARTGVNPNA